MAAQGYYISMNKTFGVMQAGRYISHDVVDDIVQKTIWNGYLCWGCLACGYDGLTMAEAEQKRKQGDKHNA